MKRKWLREPRKNFPTPRTHCGKRRRAPSGKKKIFYAISKSTSSLLQEEENLLIYIYQGRGIGPAEIVCRGMNFKKARKGRLLHDREESRKGELREERKSLFQVVCQKEQESLCGHTQ